MPERIILAAGLLRDVLSETPCNGANEISDIANRLDTLIDRMIATEKKKMSSSAARLYQIKLRTRLIAIARSLEAEDIYQRYQVRSEQGGSISSQTAIAAEE